MKSEHRHELQTNDLSRLTAKAVPYLEQHGNKIVIVICAILLATAGGIWLSRATSSGDVAAWSALSTARNAEDLEAVADEYADTLPGKWAILRSAELQLEDGLRATFRDHEAAQTDLKAGEEKLETLLSEGRSLHDDIRERALFAMARLLETTSGGDTQPAIEAYQRLIEEFPESVYQPVAAERIEALKKGGSQQFYAWFAEQKPTPPDRSAPADVAPLGGGGGSRELNLEDILPPGATGGNASGAGNPTPGSTPAPGSTPIPGSAPAPGSDVVPPPLSNDSGPSLTIPDSPASEPEDASSSPDTPPTTEEPATETPDAAEGSPADGADDASPDAPSP